MWKQSYLPTSKVRLGSIIFLNIYWIPFMLCRLWFWREAGYFCPSIGHCLYNPPEFQRACTNVHRFVEQYIDSLNLSNENGSLDDR